MIEKRQYPYEFLARWKSGVFVGAHVQFITEVVEDGNVLGHQLGEVMPVDIGGGKGFPLADVLAQMHTDAIKQMETANAECACHKAECEKHKAERDAAKAELTAALNASLEKAKSEVETLTTRLAELKPADAQA